MPDEAVSRDRQPQAQRDLTQIKSDVRLLKWITGTTLAGVLALVLRTFTS